jgi:ABC-type phosphate transport system substrate-binding protein
MNKSNLKNIVLTCLVLITAGAVSAAPIMIAHPGVPDAALDQGAVQNIFLGKTAQWSDGSGVSIVMLKGGDVSDAFLKANVKKSHKQFATFWKKAVFSGTGEMPAAFETEADLIMHVSRTPGAVGYIDDGTPHDDVKVIAIQ